MRKFFYLRLALSNIRRSRKFYFPYMLACTFTIAMFYIVCAISVGHALDGVSGADVLKSYTIIGAFVVAIFAAIFLFYTNSFLTKRRRREFGLYNILGMERRHIARVMLDETLLVALVTLGAGIAGGLGLAKLVALIAVKLVRGQAAFGMEFVPAAAQATLIAFAVIYALSYLVELARMARSSTLDLLNSAQQGEREPKTRWLMALIGLACLGGGYWIAITTQDVLTAVAVFFLAVILVIAGTYPAVHCRQHRGAEQALLLQAEPLHLRVWHDLPHEAERRRIGDDLHPLDDGAGDGLLNGIAGHRHGGQHCRTLSARDLL